MKRIDLEALLVVSVRLTNRVNEKVKLKQAKIDNLKDYTDLIIANTSNILEQNIEKRIELCKNN